MAANAWSPNSNTVTQANATGLIKEELHVAMQDQRAFDITTFAYVVGTGSTQVFKNGIRLIRTQEYIEISPTQILLTDPADDQDQIIIVAFVGITGTAVVDAQLRQDLLGSYGASIVNFLQNGSITTRSLQAKLSDVLDIKDFGAVCDGVTDDTSAIQKALDYAATLVTAASLGDPVNGATVVGRGVCKITKPLIMNKGNVSIRGQGGFTIKPYFPTNPVTYNGATPAIIVGTGTGWYTGGFTTVNKYNKISNVNIKVDSGQGPYVGILVSGMRNPVIEDCLIENSYVGIYVENTSELRCSGVSIIGATYARVLDNRKNRSAANSILKVASTSNDVSSCNFYMTTTYYSQWCSLVAINAGTVGIHGETVGQFSIGSSVSVVGLPAIKAGWLIYGDSSGNFTRGFYASNAVFEADSGVNSDCVRIETNGPNCPICNVTLKNLHVQTYAANPGVAMTTLLRTKQVSSPIYAVSVENCGFTPQSSGYYYGRMHVVDAGSPVVKFRSCFPDAAFNSMDGDFGYFSKNMDVVEIDTIVPFSVYPPAGWTANGTAGVIQGGSSGQFAYMHLTGSVNEMSISKTEVYREYGSHLGYVYISFLARGDTGLLVRARINSQADSDSTTVNDTNVGRYSNAIVQPTLKSTVTWQRVVYCFNQFDDAYTFDNVTFTIGKAATASAANFVDIADVRIGYTEGGFVKYNPFS